MTASTPAANRKAQIDAVLLKLPGVSARKINGLDAYFVNDRMFACISGEGIGLRLPVGRGDRGCSSRRTTWCRSSRAGCRARGSGSRSTAPTPPTTRRISSCSALRWNSSAPRAAAQARPSNSCTLTGSPALTVPRSCSSTMKQFASDIERSTPEPCWPVVRTFHSPSSLEQNAALVLGAAGHLAQVFGRSRFQQRNRRRPSRPERCSSASRTNW